MPGIDSIKKKKSVEKKSAAFDDDLILHLFPEEKMAPAQEVQNKHSGPNHSLNKVRTKKIFKHKSSSPPLLSARRIKRALIYLVCVFLVAGAVAYLATIKLRSLAAESTAIQNQIYLSLDAVKANLNVEDIGKISGNLKTIEANITKSKMLLQRNGQDLVLYRYLNPKSKIVQKEALIDTLYASKDDLKSIRFAANKINPNLILNNKGTLADFGDTYQALSQVADHAEKLALNINNNLPRFSAGDRTSLESKIMPAFSIFNLYKSNQENLDWLMATGDQKRTVLIIFQNNRELRGGSGGSLGSFGVATIQNGKISKINFGTNIYKLDAAFKAKTFVQSPSELEAFGQEWTMKQSGFAVDGKESLDKIRWFYEQETGEHADIAMTVDNTTIANLLSVLGAIDMPAYGKTITSENFAVEMEDEVQNDYFKREGGKTENEPKKIIADMMPIFFDRFFDGLKKSDIQKQILSAITNSFQEKHILLNFENDKIQKIARNFNTTGEVTEFSGDYIYLNNSNLAGAKTNQSIKETLGLKVNIDKDGKINNEALLTREHQGFNKWPDGLDRNYVRVLLPEGSQITSFEKIAGNFQRYYDRGYKNGQPFWTDHEAGRSTLNFWMSTMPQKTSKASFNYLSGYQVNTSDDFEYIINFQRQPGAPADNINLELTYPEGFSPIGFQPQDGNKLQFKINLKEDGFVKVKFKKISK